MAGQCHYKPVIATFEPWTKESAIDWVTDMVQEDCTARKPRKGDIVVRFPSGLGDRVVSAEYFADRFQVVEAGE